MARPKSEDKKQALLEAATAAFAQSGIAASTSAIARSAGVAEGTLFRYFATKDELLNELYLAIKLRLVRTMIAGLDPDEKRPKENARNIWNSYIDWGVRNPMEHKCGEVIVYAWMDRRRENSEKPYGTRLRAGLAVSARLVGKCDFLEIYALTSALLWIVSVSS